MEEKIKAIVIAGFCLGPEIGDVFPRDTVELTPYQYRVEVGLRRVKAVPADDTDAKAMALEQAKQELLEKIRQAPDLDSLEDLLTEDPEIVAAYEQRMLELDEPHH